MLPMRASAWKKAESTSPSSSARPSSSLRVKEERKEVTRSVLAISAASSACSSAVLCTSRALDALTALRAASVRSQRERREERSTATPLSWELTEVKEATSEEWTWTLRRSNIERRRRRCSLQLSPGPMKSDRPTADSTTSSTSKRPFVDCNNLDTFRCNAADMGEGSRGEGGKEEERETAEGRGWSEVVVEGSLSSVQCERAEETTSQRLSPAGSAAAGRRKLGGCDEI